MTDPILLGGDIGGTKTRLAFLQATPDGVRILREQTFPSGAFPSLEAILAQFLGTREWDIQAVGLGIAGPICERRCQATNLPWSIDANALERGELGLPRVSLCNDLEATAWGIQTLPETALYLLHPGHPDPQGNRSVIAAGTGLGEAGVCWDGGRWRPFASEGGHTDFAPADALQWDLYQHLERRFGHVSWERILSGPGILEMHGFLRNRAGAPCPPALAEELARSSSAAAVSDAASAGDPVCVQTLDLFFYLYGRETGNQALKIMATGGVYLGGGIVPKLLVPLVESRFLEGYFAKGRMEPLLRRMPVWVILDDRAALYGAALAALGAGKAP